MTERHDGDWGPAPRAARTPGGFQATGFQRAEDGGFQTEPLPQYRSGWRIAPDTYLITLLTPEEYARLQQRGAPTPPSRPDGVPATAVWVGSAFTMRDA